MEQELQVVVYRVTKRKSWIDGSYLHPIASYKLDPDKAYALLESNGTIKMVWSKGVKRKRKGGKR
jgi:hypothetical protein